MLSPRLSSTPTRRDKPTGYCDASMSQQGERHNPCQSQRQCHDIGDGAIGRHIGQTTYPDHLEDEQMRKIDFHTDATQEFRQRIAKHLVVLSYGEDHPRNP